jgi:hypothetical protein
MEKETESATMIDGLLAIMPVGCRNVTYLPASAVDALAKDTSAQALLHTDAMLLSLLPAASWPTLAALSREQA